jgi:hypothetical protein
LGIHVGLESIGVAADRCVMSEWRVVPTRRVIAQTKKVPGRVTGFFTRGLGLVKEQQFDSGVGERVYPVVESLRAKLWVGSESLKNVAAGGVPQDPCLVCPAHTQAFAKPAERAIGVARVIVGVVGSDVGSSKAHVRLVQITAATHVPGHAVASLGGSTNAVRLSTCFELVQWRLVEETATREEVV